MYSVKAIIQYNIANIIEKKNWKQNTEKLSPTIFLKFL